MTDDSMLFDPADSARITPDDWQTLEQQLGRQPRGCQEVVCRKADATPVVIRVASIVDDIPFPTLYWLSDRELADLIYRYESQGATQQLQALVDDNESLQQQMILDNEQHIRIRASYHDESVIAKLRELGIEESFAKKGFGGNANFLRIRCLHAWLAAHLVHPNVVGELLMETFGPADPLVKALGQVH